MTDDLVRSLAEDIEGLDVDRLFEDADGQEVVVARERVDLAGAGGRA